MAVADGSRTLKVGLMHSLATGTDGGVPRWTEIRDIAKLTEDIGLDSFWIPDHLLYQMVGEDEPRGYWEAWSILSGF